MEDVGNEEKGTLTPFLTFFDLEDVRSKQKTRFSGECCISCAFGKNAAGKAKSPSD